MTPRQTFHDHVVELRRRLFWCVCALAIGGAIGYLIHSRVVTWLQHPLGLPLFYAEPAGGFNFAIKASILVGTILALPVMIYQLLRFIEPAFVKVLRAKLFWLVALLSLILAGAGAAFALFVMVPMSLHFFAGYSSSSVKPLISAAQYLNFIINTLITFAIIFQIPLVIWLANTITPIPPRQLLKYQRHVIVGAFVLALILPFTYDPISQFVMAAPIVALYYLSVIGLWFSNGRRRPEIIKPEPQRPQSVATHRPIAPARPVPVNPWQSSLGGLVEGRRHRTAVDVLKPGTISASPLKLS